MRDDDIGKALDSLYAFPGPAGVDDETVWIVVSLTDDLAVQV
jgi:hypothetical protein